jgi:hypothetical protein
MGRSPMIVAAQLGHRQFKRHQIIHHRKFELIFTRGRVPAISRKVTM